MTQTASISSLNKKAFLEKAMKGFGTDSSRSPEQGQTPPLPTPEDNANKKNGS